MNKNAKKWIKALRSGEYKQTKEFLRIGDKFCCLGVACDLYGKSKKIPWDDVLFLDEREHLPQIVIEWLGLNNGEGEFQSTIKGENFLTGLNDSGRRFKTIANIIESEPEGLFK